MDAEYYIGEGFGGNRSNMTLKSYKISGLWADTGRRLENYCWMGEEQQSDCSDKWQCVKKVTELAEKVVIGNEQRWTNNWFDQKCEATVEKENRPT